MQWHKFASVAGELQCSGDERNEALQLWDFQSRTQCNQSARPQEQLVQETIEPELKDLNMPLLIHTILATIYYADSFRLTTA
jgi:hypothetical protein